MPVRDRGAHASRARAPIACILLLIAAGPGPGEARSQEASPRAVPRQPPESGPLYRFHERYSARDRRGTGGVIGQYRAAFRETIAMTPGAATGRPTPAPTVGEAVFQERPAEVDRSDPRRVVALVRRYTAARMTVNGKPAPEAAPPVGPILRCTPRDGEMPAVAPIAPGRNPGDRELFFARSQIFVPGLAFVLSERPIPIGDTWVISEAGMAALLGRHVRRGVLAARLSEVDEDPARRLRTALIEIHGEVLADVGIATVKARLRFNFDPAFATRAADGGRDVLDAPGSIVSLTLSQRTLLADRRDPKAGVVSRELIMERRITDEGAELPLPRVDRPGTPAIRRIVGLPRLLASATSTTE